MSSQAGDYLITCLLRGSGSSSVNLEEKVQDREFGMKQRDWRHKRSHITKHSLQSVTDFEIHPQRDGVKTPKSFKQENHNIRAPSDRELCQAAR